MAAPKKPATDLIKQVKVHVKVSDLKVYDRKKIESLIEADKTRTSKSSAEITKEGAIKVKLSTTPSAYTQDEQALIDKLISNYRKSQNKLYFINRATQLK